MTPFCGSAVTKIALLRPDRLSNCLLDFPRVNKGVMMHV